MDGGIIFFNSFMSYLLLMIIIVCVAALGFVVGRVLRNKKDSGAGNEAEESKVTKAISDN